MTLGGRNLIKFMQFYIQSDNSAEFTTKLGRGWMNRFGPETLFIEPGVPWDNGNNETFNGKLVDELLNRVIFYMLKEAKIMIEQH